MDTFYLSLHLLIGEGWFYSLTVVNNSGMNMVVLCVTSLIQACKHDNLIITDDWEEVEMVYVWPELEGLNLGRELCVLEQAMESHPGV